MSLCPDEKISDYQSGDALSQHCMAERTWESRTGSRTLTGSSQEGSPLRLCRQHCLASLQYSGGFLEEPKDF